MWSIYGRTRVKKLKILGDARAEVISPGCIILFHVFAQLDYGRNYESRRVVLHGRRWPARKRVERQLSRVATLPTPLAIISTINIHAYVNLCLYMPIYNCAE